MNKLIIIGNLTADPVLNQRQSGEQNVSVCNFTVAANSGFGDNQKTTYFRVNAWRGLADTCAKYLAKGRKVCVVGAVSARSYTGNDGNIYTTLEVRADEVEFCSTSNDRSAAPAQQAPNYDAPVEQPPATQVVETDELPF